LKKLDKLKLKAAGSNKKPKKVNEIIGKN